MRKNPLDHYVVGPIRRNYDLVGIFAGTILLGLIFGLILILLDA